MVNLFRRLTVKTRGFFPSKSPVALIILLLTYNGLINSQESKRRINLLIRNIDLEYPSPGIPFYHFKAEMELPESSIIEVEASVNGKVLRATDLHRTDEILDLNRPPLTHRPPSGYGLAQDATLYRNFTVIGWIKWQPGLTYDIKFTFRIKRTVAGSKDDVFLSETRTVKAPEKAQVFDQKWKRRKGQSIYGGNAKIDFYKQISC